MSLSVRSVPSFLLCVVLTWSHTVLINSLTQFQLVSFQDIDITGMKCCAVNWRSLPPWTFVIVLCVQAWHSHWAWAAVRRLACITRPWSTATSHRGPTRSLTSSLSYVKRPRALRIKYTPFVSHTHLVSCLTHTLCHVSQSHTHATHTHPVSCLTVTHTVSCLTVTHIVSCLVVHEHPSCVLSHSCPRCVMSLSHAHKSCHVSQSHTCPASCLTVTPPHPVSCFTVKQTHPVLCLTVTQTYAVSCLTITHIPCVMSYALWLLSHHPVTCPTNIL